MLRSRRSDKIPASGTFAVAQIVASLEVGGAETTAVDFANVFARRGLVSHLMSLKEGGELAAKVDPRVTLWCAKRSGRYDWRCIWRLRRYLRQNQIVVAHCHARTPAYAVAILRCFTGLRCVFIFHDQIGAVADFPLWRLLDSIFLRGVDLYYAASRPLQARARRILGRS